MTCRRKKGSFLNSMQSNCLFLLYLDTSDKVSRAKKEDFDRIFHRSLSDVALPALMCLCKFNRHYLRASVWDDSDEYTNPSRITTINRRCA